MSKSYAEVAVTDLAARERDLERRVSELARKINDLYAKVTQGMGLGFGGGGDTRDVVYALTGGGGIPARVTTTLGSGTVTLYTKSGATLTSTATTATCYNASATAVGASKVIGMILRADASGEYDAVLESC